MPNTKKIQTVKDITQKVDKATSITFFDYRSLGSNAMNDLRNKAKDISGEVLVAKNTLVKIALGDKKAQEDDLQGQTGVLFSFGDSISPLKVLFDFAKKFETLKIKGAFIDGKYYDRARVAQVSALPSKIELLTRVLGGFKHPINSFVNVLGGTRGKFVYALSAIAKKKGVDE